MNEQELEMMFNAVNLRSEDLHQALINMAGELGVTTQFIRGKEDRARWEAENIQNGQFVCVRPTIGCCSFVSEMVHHFLLNKESQPYVLRTETGTHWFLKLNGQVIDLTADQIDGRFEYEKAKRKNFMTKQPSKRAVQLWEELQRVRN